jgi:hypothetical protein
MRKPILTAILLSAGLVCARPAAAQYEAKEEVVANLAAGRVTIFVARDAILFAIASTTAEAASRPPLVVPLSGRRIAVLFGAVEWVQPATGRPPLRLDRELPRLLGEVAGPKRLEAEHTGDIESLGTAMLEPLRAAAAMLHGKIEFPEEELLLQMLIVGYAADYGPEVWLLKYRMRQDFLRDDYWRTRVLRPIYEQLYPPEKGQPRTLIEARYPPEDTEPGLPELLAQNDPRLARVRSATPLTAKAAERLAKGESHKTETEAAMEFFRAALNATIPAETELAIGIIRERQGLEWVIAPRERPETAEVTKPREPGAPTLQRKPPE